ncbi:hypothetical protein FLA_2176 [Filimonas lacunae]|nr:hypothetical protein FLA_2176 [Filimonas lacunae]
MGYFEKVDRKYKTIYLHYYNAFEYKEVKAATHVRRGLLEDLGDAMSETVYYQRWFDVVYLEGDAAKPTTMKLVLDFIGLIMLVFPVYTSGKLLIKGGKVFSRERNKSKGRSRKQLGKSGRMYKHS